MTDFTPDPADVVAFEAIREAARAAWGDPDFGGQYVLAQYARAVRLAVEEDLAQQGRLLQMSWPSIRNSHSRHRSRSADPEGRGR